MRRRDSATRRSAALTLVAALTLLAACSGSDAGDADGVGEASDVGEPDEVTSTPTTSIPGTVAAGATTTDDEPPASWTVRVDYAIMAADGGNGGRDGLEGTFDPLSDDPVDPFRELASCSGWRDSVGAYSVTVHGEDATRLVSLSVADVVAGAGTYDALVRIERDDRALDIPGTVTLAEGLQAGEFTALGVDGDRVDGAFRCDGGGPPLPLELGDPGDDRLDTIEVTALLRQDGQTVIVGLAADAPGGSVCEIVDGVAAVSITGDAGIGSMTAFELAAIPAELRMTVGGTSFEFENLEIPESMADDATRASGTFSADADGVEVDGAFRCT